MGQSTEGSALVAAIKSSSVVHFLFAFIYICSGLIINTLQALTMVFWWSGNRDLYRTLNIRLAYIHWALIPFLSEWWACVKINFYMKPEDLKKVNNENGIVVLNHKYDMDWVIGWVIGDRVKILGNAKCMAKKSLSYVPIMGWAWRFCEYIFVKRNLEADSKTVMKDLGNLSQFKHYFWMLIYCEGTRYTEDKHERSMEVAKSKGLKPLKHHLLPRTKGFRMLTQGLRESASAVYDCTVCVKNQESPTLMDLLNGKSYEIGFLCVRRPIEEIPNEEEECAAYLHEMYQEKDRDFDYFDKHGTFEISGEDVEERLKGTKLCNLPRRTECLWISIAWACLILTPLFYYIWGLISSGAWFKVGLMTFVLFTVTVIFQKILAQGTVSSSSSTYGSAKKME